MALRKVSWIVEESDVFGRLTVGERAEDYVKGKVREPRFTCACLCGGTTVARKSALTSGRKQSCGCLHMDATRATHLVHGESGQFTSTPEYRAWRAMHGRCLNPKDAGYKNYGGRGITVCDRWRFGEGGLTGFQCFLEDMGRKPAPGHSLDRYPDVDGGYGPGNCRWATDGEQANNQRSNIVLAFKGKSQTMARWAAGIGINYCTLKTRIQDGWPVERALTERPQMGRRKKTAVA